MHSEGGGGVGVRTAEESEKLGAPMCREEELELISKEMGLVKVSLGHSTQLPGHQGDVHRGHC